MKFINSLFFLSVISCLAPVQLKAQTSIVLKGKFISCKPLEKKIKISAFYGTQLQLLDSASVSKKGEFVFQLKIPMHAGYYRIYTEKSNYTDIILTPGESPKLEFNGCKLKDWKSVNGSLENQLLLESRLLSQSEKDKNKMFQQLQVMAQKNTNTFFGKTTLAYLPLELTLPDTFPTMQKKAEYIYDHYFDHVDFSSGDIVYSTLLPNIYMRLLEQFTQYDEEGFKATVDKILNKAQANELVYAFSMNYLIELFKKVGPEIVLEYIVENYYFKYSCGSNEILSQETRSVIEGYNQLMPGNKIPEIKFTTINTDSSSLKEVYSKNKITLVIFWSSYCHFCALKASEWKKLYEQYNKKGLEIIYVSLDTDEKEWKSAIASKALNGIHTSDLKGWESPVAQLLHVNRTPYIYIISKEGEILLKDPTTEQLNTYLSNYLN